MKTVVRFAVGVCLLIVVLFAGNNTVLGAKSPDLLSAKGQLDLSEWDVHADSLVSLDGEWEFYWSRLLTPRDFQQTNLPDISGYFRSPGYWNRGAVASSLPADGFATIRLTARIPHMDEMLAIKTNNIFSAYRIWVNGNEIAAAGKVGTTAASAVPKQIVQVAPFHVRGDRLEIIIQLSNYSYTKSGLQGSLILGSAKQVMERYQRDVEGAYLSFGACSLMAIYHLMLYMLRRGYQSALYFGVFCLLVSIRILFVNDRYIYNWFPDLNWELFSKVPYAVFYFGLSLVMTLVYSLYPEFFSRRVLRLTQWISALSTVFCLATPQRIYDKILIPMELYTIGLIGYCLYVLWMAIRIKREDTLIFFAGFTGLSITIVHDFLYMSEISGTGSLAPYGLLIFIFAQSIILARKFSRAFRDVEQLSEKLLSMDKMKDEFLAQTSHELRTPLHGMIGLAESLLDGIAGRLPDKALGHLELIVGSGRRLGNLVADVLDYSRLKHKELRLHITEVDLHDVVHQVMQLINPLLQGKPIELVNGVPKGLTVFADENRLQQIFHNLLGNAMKHTEAGTIAVSVGRASEERIAISVRDTGEGIPEEQHERIFQAYEQVGDSLTPGTGLGLAITRKLVELHEGKLQVQNAAGSGTTFTFELPTVRGQALKSELLPSSLLRNQDVLHNETTELVVRPQEILVEEFEGIGDAGSHHILIVDDEQVNLQVLRDHLHFDRYKVTEAADSKQALHLIESGFKPDLLILDVMMPKMSGFELCSMIRKSYSASELPIILLTAKSLGRDLMEGFDSGANDYLTKPVMKSELLARVRLHLQISKWNQALEDRVTQRTVQLEDTLESLHQAKIRLIQAEKLASLGGLVAGIAHEINSPIGIGVTASSHLVSLSGEMAKKYAQGILSRKELTSFISELEETSSLLLSNLQRTEKLISSFKQVAVDQTAEEERVFQVKSYLMDIFQSLRPKWKNSNHRFFVEVDESLELFGYPGAFYQLMTNLILNSLLHGFEGVEHGTITIQAQADGEMLEFVYRDDGRGIDSSLISRIFDPFVTTKRGQGGTGLGLSIVYNIVTQLWQGSIRCESELNEGTVFTIRLPLIAGVGRKLA
ncbi:ATP-binding protein [Paenibacillus sp. GCM10027628]|uniref:ATP-binding protein n=1 Tax=Paenibacillus sp. GCM10027628 TaxID=3273413 RepID=UPI003627F007